MAVEKKLLGIERESQHCTEMDLPKIPRKYALVCLLYRLRSVTRDDIERLAQQIYQDVLSGQTNSLHNVCTRVGLINGKSQHQGDIVLEHIALRYDKREMTKEYHEGPIQNDVPRSPVDTLAGGGPARPILKELYSLNALGYVRISRDAEDREIFEPTYHGGTYAHWLEVIFSFLSWDRRPPLVIGRYDVETPGRPG